MADGLVKKNGPDALARHEASTPAEAARLEVAQARARLAQSTRALKADLRWLKLPVQLTTSVQKNPLLWVGGALVLGAMLGAVSAGFPRREHGNE